MATVKRWTSDELTNALKKHGLFEEAKQFQADRQKELESNPKTSRGTKKQAWFDMHDVYRAKVVSIEGAGELIGAPAETFTAEDVQAAVAARANGTDSAEPIRRPRLTPDQVDRTCSDKDSIDWVMKNIYVESPDPERCPSYQAAFWWCTYRGNPSKFNEVVVMKQAKEQMDNDRRMNDDGRSITTLVSRCEQLRDAAESALKQAVG